MVVWYWVTYSFVYWSVNNVYCCVVNVVSVVPFLFVTRNISDICNIGFIDSCNGFNHKCLICTVAHKSYCPDSRFVIVCSTSSAHKLNFHREYITDVNTSRIGTIIRIVNGNSPDNSVIYVIYLFVSSFYNG